MEVKGKIIEIMETAKVTESFQKREFVIEYAENPQYPEFLKFELIQDKCALLDGFNAGEEITVQFNLKGRKWTDRNGEVKYFNSLQAWRIEKGESDMPPPPDQEDWSGGDDETDVLPF